MKRLSLTFLVVSTVVSLWGCGGATTSVEDEPVALTIRRLDRQSSLDSRALERNPSSQRLSALAPYVLPYSTDRVISDFWDCRGSRQHRGIDLAGVGPNAGLGTPVVSLGRARITLLGTPEEDSAKFGRRLTEDGTVVRGGEELPTWGMIPGYGHLYYFTENHGRWHTGVIVSTEVLEGPLEGHQVRYMHLAA
ncbi:MAG: hypothetical protein KC561_14300, partial [Myxococcales bacterium]|nr:hypothetical protein [Myxococcales bacterium]